MRLAVLLAVSLTLAQVGAREIGNGRQPRTQLLEEFMSAYPIIALRNPNEKIVRIYGQFQTHIVGNKTAKGQSSQLAGCLMKGQGKEEMVNDIHKIEELTDFDEERAQLLLSFSNYYIDCRDPGDWAGTVVLRLQNGQSAGAEIEITNMEGKRRGRLGVCSQSLHTHADWLKDWVDHQFAIGADEVILHAPKGEHIDDLFNNNRQNRLDFYSKLSRRARRHVGNQPLGRFERANTLWQEYYASPSAQFHADELIFSACHYRLRYAYDYTVQFDIDEFWVPGKNSEAKSLPVFLDQHMKKDAATIGFHQILYPMECQTRNSGSYLGRFTLHERLEGEEKLAVRPISIDRMQIHGLLGASVEYLAKGLQPQDYHWTVPAEMAFLKTIRWDVNQDADGTVTYNECKFGQRYDPEETGLTIE